VEQRSFLADWTTDPFDRVAAERAQAQKLSAATPQLVQALFAEEFMAMQAAIGRRVELMPATLDGAAGVQHRRRWDHARQLELGNAHGDFGIGDQELHIAQTQRLAGEQNRFLDGGAIDERAVG
jgi:hypothetical protein